MKSLAAAPVFVETHAQALALPYIGPTMASIIVVNGSRTSRNTTAATATANATRQPKAPPKASTAARAAKKAKSSQTPTIGGGSQTSMASSSSSTAAACDYTDNTSTNNRKRSNNNNRTGTISTKEANYQKAVWASENWKSNLYNAYHNNNNQLLSLTWKVILLIDCRERKSEHVQAKCEMSGIPCEERQLPIGDMAWIAQGLLLGNGSTAEQNAAKQQQQQHSKAPPTVVVELLLGTIIERKTPDDLKHSIFGTRYYEQRLRLQECGLPQLVYLMEGDMTKSVYSCSAETLHTAIWETRLYLNFSIVHTAHMAETVATLKRMHRRILQRTFPRAFGRTEATSLPTFVEATMSVEQRRRSLEAAAAASGGNQRNNHQRRQRRRQSLTEMTFDMDPIPPLGMKRFMTYPELKAKVELDREAGTRTVASLHLSMLKQVPTLETKKCHAVAQVYPTMNSLLQALEENDDSNNHSTDNPNPYYSSNNSQPSSSGNFLAVVADLTTQNSLKQSMVRRTVGTNSAEQLQTAYGYCPSSDSNSNNSTKNGGAKKTPPETLPSQPDGCNADDNAIRKDPVHEESYSQNDTTLDVAPHERKRASMEMLCRSTSSDEEQTTSHPRRKRKAPAVQSGITTGAITTTVTTDRHSTAPSIHPTNRKQTATLVSTDTVYLECSSDDDWARPPLSQILQARSKPSTKSTIAPMPKQPPSSNEVIEID